MIRGTTPVVILNLPMEIPFEVLYVTFQQKGKTVLEKTLPDLLVQGAKVYIRLTQADTLAFDAGKIVDVQLRGRAGEQAYASKVVHMLVSDIFKDGEI